MQTFWVVPNGGGTSTVASSDGSTLLTPVENLEMKNYLRGHEEQNESMAREKLERLVAWNVEVLYKLLQAVIAGRQGTEYRRSSSIEIAIAEKEIWTNSSIVIEEAVSVLPMPTFTWKQQRNVEIADCVKEQLHDFVMTVAQSYRSVPFHNFEHASHVIMSSTKAMERIMKPDNVDYDGREEGEVSREIHESTYGISGYPLLQFAAVFSALIRKFCLACIAYSVVQLLQGSLTFLFLDDVDHTGLTNAELAEDDPALALSYKARSIAEQRSVDVAWNFLMQEKYEDLRFCIYSTVEELIEFRQLVVNAVIATDIADKELKTLREERWDLAFTQDLINRPGDHVASDRRATVVYEYIIQASDIAHTMQHWKTYQKFNTRLFEERYVSWLNGHSPNDPSEGWYKGELWFFDNYIIPLAQKVRSL